MVVFIQGFQPDSSTILISQVMPASSEPTFSHVHTHMTMLLNVRKRDFLLLIGE